MTDSFTEMMDKAITAPNLAERFTPIAEYLDGMTDEEFSAAHTMIVGHLFRRLDEKRADSSILFSSNTGDVAVAGTKEVQRQGQILAYELAKKSDDRDALNDILTKTSLELEQTFGAVAIVALLTLSTSILDQLYFANPGLRDLVRPAFAEAADRLRAETN